jgi:AraC-like DNA-binding protein
MERLVTAADALPSGYTEHAPPDDLAPYVACFWTGRRTDGDERRDRVLPDGCVDVIFVFDDARDGELSDAIAVGPMTKPIVPDRGSRLFIGARFRPGRAFIAFGIPATELLDERVAYEAVTVDASIDVDAVAAASTDRERLHAVIDAVRRRLTGAGPVPASVRAAVKRILGASGNLRIASLASEVGVTRQQLARQFATHVGVSPKMLARVARTQAALARADAARAAYPRPLDWSAIAYELGYYDQPHFIDDFKAITGMTPGDWLRAR